MLQRSSAAAENSMLSFANSVSTIHPKDSSLRGSGEFSAGSPSVDAENRSWLNGLAVLSPQRPISSRSGRERVTFSDEAQYSKHPKKHRSGKDYSTLTGRRIVESAQGLRRGASFTDRPEATRALVTHPSRSLTSAPRESSTVHMRRTKGPAVQGQTGSMNLPPKYPLAARGSASRPSSAPTHYSALRAPTRSRLSGR